MSRYASAPCRAGVRRGTRAGTAASGTHKQATGCLRCSSFDDAPMANWPRDNRSGLQAYRVPARGDHRAGRPQAPSLHGALLAAKAAGHSHVRDGTLIATDRIATPGPNPA